MSAPCLPRWVVLLPPTYSRGSTLGRGRVPAAPATGLMEQSSTQSWMGITRLLSEQPAHQTGMQLSKRRLRVHEWHTMPPEMQLRRGEMHTPCVPLRTGEKVLRTRDLLADWLPGAAAAEAALAGGVARVEHLPGALGLLLHLLGVLGQQLARLPHLQKPQRAQPLATGLGQ